MKLIDKDKVTAEIERRIKTNKECMLGLRNLDYYQGKVDALNDTLSFIDTIEVKEADLLEEMANQYETNYEEYLTYEEFANIAEHFFELGVKAQKGG